MLSRAPLPSRDKNAKKSQGGLPCNQILTLPPYYMGDQGIKVIFYILWMGPHGVG